MGMFDVVNLQFWRSTMVQRLFHVLTSTVLSLSFAADDVAADSFGSGANQFEIEFVEIGDPGNAADMTGDPTGDPNPPGAGAVEYIYNIGKFEISRDMVEKASTEGELGLTLDPMDFVTGGPRPDMPATGVSWNEAARFINWLNTSQGFPAAYKFGAQPGEDGYDANANIELWVDGDPGFDAANPFRNSQAQYFLPSVNEWYKAAYYDPAAGGGAGGYWDFPDGSDEMAPMAVASGTDPNTAVYSQELAQGPADITQAGGLSPYGVMGLGGNVWEWEETEFDLMNDGGSSLRGVRGGRWDLSSGLLSASSRFNVFPSSEGSDIGFRVASIPEPSSQLLGLLGMLGLRLRRRGQ
jgi:hypothetical protein